MIIKDVKLSFRDRKTLALIVLTPLMIMLLLSIVFSSASQATSITGISLGMCNLDGSEFNLELPIFNVFNLEQPCEEDAKNLVEKGYLRAAIVIPADFSEKIEEGHGSNLRLYVDSAKGQVALVSSNAVKALVQEINEKIGIAFIQTAWENLKNLNDKLKIVVTNLKQVRDEINLVNEQLNAATEALKGTDVSQMQQSVDNLASNINESERLLNNSLVLLNAIDIQQLNGSLGTLESVYNDNCIRRNNFDPQTCSLLDITIQELRRNIIRIHSLFVPARDNLNVIGNNLLEQRETVNNLSRQFGTISNFTANVEELNATLSAYNQQIITTIDELEYTSQLLEVYTARDPKNIITAVSLEEDFAHGEKTFFEILVPGIASVILLFILLLVSSLNIVSERNSGTMARTLLSPTTIVLFLIGKIGYLLVLAGIEVLVMLGVLFFASKYLLLSQGVYSMLVLISITFILIGICIGCFARNENTALLMSLVLAIPMMFLSNVFFPFEIMPNFMKVVGENLPLSLAIESLEKLLIYDAPVLPASILKLMIYCLVLFVIAYMLIKKNPTSS